jgi:hypothetical protein
LLRIQSGTGIAHWWRLLLSWRQWDYPTQSNLFIQQYFSDSRHMHVSNGVGYVTGLSLSMRSIDARITGNPGEL